MKTTKEYLERLSKLAPSTVAERLHKDILPDLKLEQLNLCFYCLKENPDTVDHLIPKSKGGSHHKDNLVAACKKCNDRKADLNADEFIAIISQGEEAYIQHKKEQKREKNRIEMRRKRLDPAYVEKQKKQQRASRVKNREKHILRHKKYREENSEIINKKARDNYQKNREDEKRKSLDRYHKNKDAINTKKRAESKQRYKNDPEYRARRLSCNRASRARCAAKKKAEQEQKD